MSQNEPITQSLNRVQLSALVIALLGIVFSMVGAFSDIDHFFRSYLVAFLFWTEVSLGCLALLMLVNIVSGRWAYAIKRLAAAGARVLPLMAIIFIPLLFGLSRIYPWAVEGWAEGELVNDKLFLSTPLVLLRAVIYFVVWIGLAYVITNLSYRHDETGDEATMRRMQRYSVVGMILFFITASFAAIDWTMSLNDHWYSSVFGWLTISRQVLAGVAFLIVALAFFWSREAIARVMNQQVLVDLGAILLASLLTWIYLSFTQFFIMWAGNLPSKVDWYTQRTAGMWGGYANLLILFHAIALLFLLAPGLKRVRPLVVGVALLLLVLRLAELYWVVMPVFSDSFSLQWWDLALPVGFGGLWVALFLWLLGSHSLVPVNDPKLQAALSEHGEEAYEPAQATS